eukprot:GHRQ01005404.1.p1 GENE.GHRQ01005404.1~~GHRQ01005404.1.p1  ORF type:complete len:357 (+),score=130.25 GHRQ01005404.1:487-1557(+)
MQALVYDQASDTLNLEEAWAKPTPGPEDALIRVHRAGICATDIEVTRGYVPGYHGVLGHEFVGRVERCSSRPELQGQRVVGEINCNDGGFSCADAAYQRNHAPGRSVLGIINRDGCMSQWLVLPARNLLTVPSSLADELAVFCEPLAAACRILEQGLLQQDGRQQVAVVGDGRLGLLIAQVLALRAPGRVTHFGRHADKMALVSGTAAQVVVTEATAAEHAGAFHLVVEASGSASSIRTALALTRPTGTLVLKTTVSLHDPAMPGWSELANDIVVNEKTLVGSRCGPMDVALAMMEQHEELQQLLAAMIHKQLPLSQGVEAMALAQTKGVLKVQLVMHDNAASHSQHQLLREATTA